MTKNEFVTKAMDGGWMSQAVFLRQKYEIGFTTAKDTAAWQEVINDIISNAAFFDAKAWQAVGRVEKWDIVRKRNELTKDTRGYLFDERGRQYTFVGNKTYLPNIAEAQNKHHQLIDALWEGKSLEEYIKTL